MYSWNGIHLYGGDLLYFTRSKRFITQSLERTYKTLGLLGNSFTFYSWITMKLIEHSTVFSSPLSSNSPTSHSHTSMRWFMNTYLYWPSALLTRGQGYLNSAGSQCLSPSRSETRMEAGQKDKQRASEQLKLTMFNSIYTSVGYLNSFIQSNKGSLK